MLSYKNNLNEKKIIKTFNLNNETQKKILSFYL